MNQKKILLIMDKKLNADLVDFFLKIPETWDKFLINDTKKKKGEIGSCCSSHALEVLIEHHFPKVKIPIDPDVKKMTKPQIEAIKPGLDINVLNVIGDWRCDDDEHNEYIDIILANLRILLYLVSLDIHLCAFYFQVHDI